MLYYIILLILSVYKLITRFISNYDFYFSFSVDDDISQLFITSLFPYIVI